MTDGSIIYVKGRFSLKKMLNWFWIKIKSRAKESWKNSKKVHRKALRNTENRWRLGIGIIIYFILVYALLGDDIKLGLSFLFAGAIAIYAGYIYKHREVMTFVLIGVALASVLIPAFWPGIRDSFKNGDYVGMVILILFGIFFWYFSGQLKKGELPDFEGKPTRRKPRRRK